ncbi:hypothetical protein EDC04DRAFT_1551770 [Pisolithus marmoratus]|nr:hypothetical protein EDC04DRAFT_1551770 [Pisolithus marmoratus]
MSNNTQRLPPQPSDTRSRLQYYDPHPHPQFSNTHPALPHFTGNNSAPHALRGGMPEQPPPPQQPPATLPALTPVFASASPTSRAEYGSMSPAVTSHHHQRYAQQGTVPPSFTRGPPTGQASHTETIICRPMQAFNSPNSHLKIIHRMEQRHSHMDMYHHMHRPSTQKT